MNINALTGQSYIGIKQLETITDAVLGSAGWMSICLFPVVLLGYTLAYRRLVQNGIGSQPYSFAVWAAALVVPVALGWQHYRHSIILQLVLMVYLNFEQTAVLLLPILMHQHPVYAVLLVLSFYRTKGNLISFSLLIVKVAAIWLTLHGLQFFLLPTLQEANAQQYISCTASRYLSPVIYQPNFSMIWLLHTHFFDRYRLLYETALFALPLFSIYPLCRIVQRLLNRRVDAQPPITLLCLFMVYYFGDSTTASDGAFYLLMLIPCHRYMAKHIPASLPLVLASILFYCLSLTVSWQWATNFTAPISYLFYMLMPYWALTVVLAVQIVNSLASLGSKRDGQIAASPPPKD